MNLEAPGSSSTPSGADEEPGASSFLIRGARPDEFVALARVAATTFPLACPPSVTAAAIELFLERNLSASRFADYVADPFRRVLVAEAEARIVGYSMLVLPDATEMTTSDPDVVAAVRLRPAAELSKLYVLPDAHGSGIARALVANSVELAREAGARSMWLGVNQRNARANRFYEKSGFELVGTKRFLVGDAYEDDFVRELPLSLSRSSDR